MFTLQILVVFQKYSLLIHVAFIIYNHRSTCSVRWYHYYHAIFAISLQDYINHVILLPTYPCPTCHEAFRVCNMLIYITNCSILPMFILICFLTIAWLLMQSHCSFYQICRSRYVNVVPTGEAYKNHKPYMLDDS